MAKKNHKALAIARSEATVLCEQGRYLEAENICRNALAQHPADITTQNLLADIYCATGNFANAEALLHSVLQQQPANPDTLSTLGKVLYLQGKTGEAERYFRQAVEQPEPGYAAQLNMANFLRAKHRNEEALSHFYAAIKTEPRVIQAYIDASSALRDLQRFDELVAVNESALKHGANHEFVYFNLGVGQLMTEQAEAAVASFRKAIKHNPANINAQFNLGTAYAKLNQPAEAAAAFRSVLQLEPQHPGAHGALAEALEQSNQVDSARQVVEQGLALHAGDPTLLLINAQLLRREKRLDEAAAALEALENTGDDERIHYTSKFELARIYDRLDRPDAAWSKLTEANQLQAASTRGAHFDPMVYQQELAFLRSSLTGEWVESWQARKLKPHPPLVFLVGFPRSGTTLLDQIIDAHPSIQVMEEKDCIHAVQVQAFGSLGEMVERLPVLSDKDIYAMRKTYFKEVKKYVRHDKNRILVDKYPLNITKVATIRRVFPEAKFILALRHPCDTCLSNYMQTYGLNHAMANFLSMENTVETYVQVMSLWQQAEELLAPDFIANRYEDLVADFESSVRQLLEFLQLEWDEAVVDYREHAMSREKINTPSYSQVVEPIYQRATQRWTKYEKYFQPFLARLQPYISKFGYDETGKTNS